jgi:hypothetical protein
VWCAGQPNPGCTAEPVTTADRIRFEASHRGERWTINSIRRADQEHADRLGYQVRSEGLGRALNPDRRFICWAWIGRMLERVLRNSTSKRPCDSCWCASCGYWCWGFFLIMALQNLGVELLPLIAGIGIAGADIALAMQGCVEQRGGWVDHHLHAPVSRGRISVSGRRGRLGCFYRPVQHHA